MTRLVPGRSWMKPVIVGSLWEWSSSWRKQLHLQYGFTPVKTGMAGLFPHQHATCLHLRRCLFVFFPFPPREQMLAVIVLHQGKTARQCGFWLMLRWKMIYWCFLHSFFIESSMVMGQRPYRKDLFKNLLLCNICWSWLANHRTL